ncbi:hypothetical protein [Streptomyces sp. NRRL S-1521]|uniref:hypothetical protein n=1 Tax=Streptomyces sp. NRRL S-1521 TaxID=1609100 RepID=UPI0007461DF9|nr:hypothetical protein ADL30_13470 [Streptomyces sp. NRRL S-1521]
MRRAQAIDRPMPSSSAAVVPIPDVEAREEAAHVMPAREGGTTVTTAEPPADLFTEQDGEAA